MASTTLAGFGSPWRDLEASDAEATRLPPGCGTAEVRAPLVIRVGMDVLEGPGIREVAVEPAEGLMVVDWELTDRGGCLTAPVEADGTLPIPRGKVVAEVEGLVNIFSGLTPSFFDRTPAVEVALRATEGTVGNGLPFEALGRAGGAVDEYPGRLEGKRGCWATDVKDLAAAVVPRCSTSAGPSELLTSPERGFNATIVEPGLVSLRALCGGFVRGGPLGARTRDAAGVLSSLCVDTGGGIPARACRTESSTRSSSAFVLRT